MTTSPPRRAAIEATIWSALILVVELFVLHNAIAAFAVASVSWFFLYALRLRRELSQRR